MSTWQIKTETINDQYYWGEFGGFRVIIREEDGYINGTKMVKDADKQLKNWNQNKQTKEYIDEVAELLELPVNQLMDVVKGGVNNELRGTYVHPLLVTHLAYWASPSFGAHVGVWIEEWKKADGNAERYYQALATMTPYQNETEEKAVQTILAAQLGCRREIPCVHGRIDLLTDHLLIEVKSCDDWMKGVGQLCCYGIQYPLLRRILYTYDGRLPREQREACRVNRVTAVSTLDTLQKLEERLVRRDTRRRKLGLDRE